MPSDNEGIKPQVGQNIRALRLKRGLTQAVLADLSQNEFVYIQRVENGLAGLTLVRAYKIAGALHCSVAELFRESRV